MSIGEEGWMARVMDGWMREWGDEEGEDEEGEVWEPTFMLAPRKVVM